MPREPPVTSATRRVALVTGGSRGIGKMIAEGFLEPGAKVYISSRKADACDATAAELSARGTCISLPQDISTVAGCSALADALTAARRSSTSWSTTPARPGAPISTSSRSTAGTR